LAPTAVAVAFAILSAKRVRFAATAVNIEEIADGANPAPEMNLKQASKGNPRKLW
jgi:hypothetical protein